MTETLHALIRILADGQFHSGEEMGRQLGIGRSAVWKALHNLPKLGLEPHAVKGRGYRLPVPVELLDEQRIRSYLRSSAIVPEVSFHLLNSTNSTSDVLKALAQRGAANATVCLAEHQTTGRGRRGRSWYSPYGSNLYLSLLWRFDDGMSRLAGLSLAVAVAMMRCFEELGATGLGIKWPNDIISAEGKVAGILVDVAGESSGPCHAIIGIGVNHGMSVDANSSIDQPWTQLLQCGVTAGRNELAACLLRHLIEVADQYEQQGFEPFRGEWLSSDMLHNQEITLHMANGVVRGIERGIDKNGLLLVESDGVIAHYSAGEVSVRRRQE